MENLWVICGNLRSREQTSALLLRKLFFVKILVVWKRLLIFARKMTKRREKQKAQSMQNRQLEQPEIPPSIKKDELLFELGKYCLDLSKLTCGAFVLTNILHIGGNDNTELFWGLVMMTGFLLLGGLFIKRGTRK